jgi:hypothetical protein
MFDPKLNHEPNKLEETLDELFDSLSFRSGDTDEYAKIVDQIQKLYPSRTTIPRGRSALTLWR